MYKWALLCLNTYMIIAGVDYSLCGPSICIYNGSNKKFTFTNCSFYFLTNTKKFATYFSNNIIGENFDDFNHEVERYQTIADWALEILMGCEHVCIEGYAYAAQSNRVFQIAENTGLLKYKLYQLGIPVTIVPPTEVKKFATGKGNSDKNSMYSFFEAETKCDLKSMFYPTNPPKEITSPISDISDSYFICKYLFDKVKDV
jgi:Holliday junction resolvasome RuvABC endonuclease subunit